MLLAVGKHELIPSLPVVLCCKRGLRNGAPAPCATVNRGVQSRILGEPVAVCVEPGITPAHRGGGAPRDERR